MDRNSSMEELHSFIKNYYQKRRGLRIFTTKLMCNPFGYLGHNKLDHLAPMLLLSFISSSILFLSYASMPYSGIDYLLLSPLQPVIAQEQISPPTSIPGIQTTVIVAGFNPKCQIMTQQELMPLNYHQTYRSHILEDG